MAFCHELLAKVKSEAGGLTAEPLYCKRWSCPVCGDRRARSLRWLGAAGQPTSFLTLTVNPARFENAGERARALRSAWRLLRNRMRRRWHAPFPFLAVFEKTPKRGEPHLHILFRGPYVPQAWISDAMRDLIGAPIVDIRFVRSVQQVAGYVAKYVSKDPKLWDGCKRYWRSQDWQLVPDDIMPKLWDHLWIVKRGFRELEHDITHVGTSVCDLVRGGSIIFGWWTATWKPLRC